MLEVRNATGAYSTAQIIHDVDLDISAGEIKAVLGRNGVGKTTLMKYLAGVLPIADGTVVFDKSELPRSASLRARSGVAYVPQGREIFPRLTVIENILVAAYACGQHGNAAIETAFEKFPALKARAQVMGGKLSGGQQQILALARALAMKPKIILLDEPTEGIQPSIIMEIQEILLELNHSEKITILLTEQNLDFVSGLATNCYLMDKGKIEREMPLAELREDKALIHDMLGV